MRNFSVILISLAAGAAVALPEVWFLAVPALAALLYILCFHTQSAKHALATGMLFGIATTGAGIWFLWDTLPLTWVPLESPVLQWLSVFVTWGHVALTLACATAVYAWFVWRARTRVFLPLFVIVGWVAQEIAKEWIYYIVTLGDPSLPGAHFSITALGYTLAEHGYLLQLADTFGIYGLNTVVIAGAATICFVSHSVVQKKAYARAVLLTLLFSTLVSVPLWNTDTHHRTDTTLRIALIGTSFPVGAEDTVIATHKKLLRDIAESGNPVDVIVFPEGSGLAHMFPDASERRATLTQLFGDTEVLIISSGYTPPDVSGATHSLLYYDSTTNGRLAVYEKMYLMAHGEYAPYISLPLFAIFNDDDIDAHFRSLGATLARGTHVVSVPYKGAVFGGLLCSEILSPTLYRTLVQEHGATVLINLSHTSWFNDSEVLFSKVLQMAKVHAVQHRKYFIQTSNGFPSFVLNPYGEIVNMTHRGQTSVLYVDIPILQE